jgi:hypothetical protein
MPKLIDPKSGEPKFYKGPGRKKDKQLGIYDAIIKKPMVIEGKINAHLKDHRPLHKLTADGLQQRDAKLDAARNKPIRRRTEPLLTNVSNPKPLIKIKKPKFGQNTPIYDKVHEKFGTVLRDHHIAEGGIRLFDKVTVRYEDGTTDVVDCAQLQKNGKRKGRRPKMPMRSWRVEDDRSDDGTTTT